MALRGPWNVEFEPDAAHRSRPCSTNSSPGTRIPTTGIKFFSGTATYRKTFELTKEQAGRLVRLQLGDVRYIAQVRLNGKDLGIVWTAPWAVELTGAVKPGRNELEIDGRQHLGQPPDRRCRPAARKSESPRPTSRSSQANAPSKPYPGFRAPRIR